MATPPDLSTKLAATLRSAGFRGPIVTGDHPDYDATRALCNAMIDRRPGVIARCVDDVDVQAAASCLVR